MYEKPKTWADWTKLLTAWAAAIVVFAAAFGLDLNKYVGPAVTVIMLTVFLGWNLYGIWANTYVSKKAKEQKKVLEQKKLL